jgi:hypothetical protein
LGDGFGFGVVGGERVIDGEALALGSGDESLELEVGALRIQDGLENVGENAGTAFGDFTVGESEEDGVENIGDVIGGHEVVADAVHQFGEMFGRAFGKVMLAERLLGGDSEVAAGASIAGNVLAAETRGEGDRRLGGLGCGW